MSDPVNPTEPPRRIADENIVRTRATDPRLRLGGARPGGGEGAEPPPAAPPPLVVTPGPTPAFLGLPGQAAPAVPDFDAPTVAQEIPVGGLALRIETGARPPLRADEQGMFFDVGPATIVDSHLPPPSAPTTTPRPPPPAPVAAPPRPTPPEPAMADDGIDFGGGAPAIRPAIEAPEFTSGGRPRPVRERRTTAPAMPVPVVETEPGTSGRGPSPVALDPPVEPSTPRVRPVALDPPVEASSGRVPRPAALDPELPPPVRPRSRADDEQAVPESSGARQRPAPTTKALPFGLLGGILAVVVVAVIVVASDGGGRGSHRYSQADEKRLADLWLDSGTRSWGGLRQDAVARAVDTVGTAVGRTMSGRLDGRTPRFVVLNDEVTVQAFALPDGTIVLTTGALRRLGNEAQLAALLAHSLAHVALGDVAAHLDRAVDVEPAVREALGGGAPKAAVELVSAAATVPQTAQKELEADALALEALAAADYVPSALADVIRNFGVRGGKRRAAWLNLHADDPARLSAIAKAPTGGRTNETEYATRILDQIGRFAPVATPTTSADEKPDDERPDDTRRERLRTLPPPPPGTPVQKAPDQAQGRPAPPDEAPHP